MQNNPKPLSNNKLRKWLDYVHQEKAPSGSYATRQARESYLRIFVQTLYDGGYNPKPENTRPKHIEHALQMWADNGISRRTIDNRLSALRWFAAEIGKPNIVKRTNDEYGMLPPREKPNYTDKARSLDQGSLGKVRDPLTHASLILQREFGLRQKEAIMIRPHEADRGDRIHLQDSWAKGGKPRDVLLTTPGQRQALDEAKALVPPGRALIPEDKDFHQQRNVYKTQTRRAGLSNMHGLRHAYAQRRYRTLTRQLDPKGEGWHCPARGGLPQDDLSKENHKIDVQARLKISEEMGHGRLRITYVYCGK